MPRRVARTDPPPETPVPERPEGASSSEDGLETDGRPVSAVDALSDEDARSDGEARRPLTNGEVSRIFHEIGDILEVKGELVFKTVAYHRAADAIARAPFEVAPAYLAAAEANEAPPPIPGVGAAIRDKLTELARTGRLAYHERLRAEIPPSLVELLKVPGVGPRTVRLVYEGLGVESLDDLRHAAEAGLLR
ncbi:MAG: helix-hairpin-helix domain-containing protein, partial [Chloroflexota bacterium]